MLGVNPVVGYAHPDALMCKCLFETLLADCKTLAACSDVQMLEAVLSVCNKDARIPVCGMISQYNVEDKEGVKNLFLVCTCSCQDSLQDTTTDTGYVVVMCAHSCDSQHWILLD